MHSSSVKNCSFSPEEISALFAPVEGEMAFSHEGLLFAGVVKYPPVDEPRRAW